MNKLASTRHNLFTLTKVSEEETAQKAAFHIEKIHDIENEIRSLSHDLTKDVFSDTNSFIKLLNELINTNIESYTIQSELEIEPQINWDLVSGHIKMHLYRIIQEGIHNSNKYAKATKITISIIQDEKKLCMAIEDNGEGFNTKETNEGIGLKNMKERIELLGGKFSIHSDFFHGTKLFMAIPAFE
jgi:signal transduction histidine kinase